jgi:hydroxymethylpyrimidine/phosphomethylpyrimidine kinase
MTHSLETVLPTWEEQLAAVERQAAAALQSARRLRKAAQEGTVATFPAAIAAMRQDADRLAEAVAQSAESPELDIADAFGNGAFLSELAAAAKAADVMLVRRDGRITASSIATPRGC